MESFVLTVSHCSFTLFTPITQQVRIFRVVILPIRTVVVLQDISKSEIPICIHTNLLNRNHIFQIICKWYYYKEYSRSMNGDHLSFLFWGVKIDVGLHMRENLWIFDWLLMRGARTMLSSWRRCCVVLSWNDTLRCRDGLEKQLPVSDTQAIVLSHHTSHSCSFHVAPELYCFD